MGKSYYSIDFGTQNIRLAVGSLINGSFLVEKLDSIYTPQDSYLDGKILDGTKLAKAVYDLVSKHSTKSKDASITLNSSNIITRELILPIANSKDIDGMISYEITQQLPIEMEQYVVEYRILEEFMEDNAKKTRVFVAAVPKTMAQSFFSFTRTVGLTPVSMNINSNSLSRLITEKVSINNVSIGNDTIAIIDFGYKFINVSIVARGKLNFSRMISQGSKDLDAAIATAFRVRPDEAENIKLKLDMSEAKDDINGEYQTAKRIISRWIQDIQRILQFYESRGNDKISKIYIYGGASSLKGLPEYIAEAISLPVEAISGISSIKLQSSIDATSIDIKDYLNAIGAIPKVGR